LRVLCNGREVGVTGELITRDVLDECVPHDWRKIGTGKLMMESPNSHQTYWQVWMGYPLEFKDADDLFQTIEVDDVVIEDRVATMALRTTPEPDLTQGKPTAEQAVADQPTAAAQLNDSKSVPR
jgi:hypothetical protein